MPLLKNGTVLQLSIQFSWEVECSFLQKDFKRKGYLKQRMPLKKNVTDLDQITWKLDSQTPSV